MKSVKQQTKGKVTLLVGTRKGAFVLKSDASRRSWKLGGPMFLGHVVHHVVSDPREPRTLMLAESTGHLGPTVRRSLDFGKTWHEASKPPAFPKAAEGKTGRVVSNVFWLTPGHISEPGVWYAGTTPNALFRSNDAGDTWQPVSGWNDHPMRETWCGPDRGGSPIGTILHSILIDPRDPLHMYFGASSGGVFETLDAGGEWQPLNAGCRADFLPNPDDAEYGHDPHCIRMHPLDPDLLYQQNHCGIYRMQRKAGRWERIGKAMPKQVGDIGFPITLHPRDTDTAWVFPMDGTDVWPRTSPGGKPAVYVTHDAGKSWKRQQAGLPKQGWLTVLRQSMGCDAHDPLGLYFGTTSGEIWASRNEGKSWSCIARHLPQVFSVDVVAR